jgi:hypothetical protein
MHFGPEDVLNAKTKIKPMFAAGHIADRLIPVHELYSVAYFIPKLSPKEGLTTLSVT